MPSVREVLEKVSRKEISPEQAEKMLKLHAVDELGCLAKLDGNRELRKGVPEIILAEGKTPSEVIGICKVMLKNCGRVIVSRCKQEHISAIQTLAAEGLQIEINKQARLAVLKKDSYTNAGNGGRVAILTAGTSDIPIAEETKVVAQEMGCTVYTYYDVGVAGIHRLLEPIKEVITNDVDVVVVVAGREGALASVVSGLVDVPVIAVPTSNSYGFGEKGVGTLMAMLQSCSLGLAVVNIDGGVAAGAVAALIAKRVAKFRK
ncbi:MAG: nickel pincer cofactor biosynthesis protein LarB [Candidatus Bathyarchaeota archaeon]|nr:nickel pincer cofactor biosynthesis protein LarB [Candidatus Bathyarchaeota archaeon]